MGFCGFLTGFTPKNPMVFKNWIFWILPGCLNPVTQGNSADFEAMAFVKGELTATTKHYSKCVYSLNC